MNNRYIKLIKNFSVLGVSNAVISFAQFLLIPLYTNVLTTAEYGIYDLSNALVLILYQVFTLSLASVIFLMFNDGSNHNHKIIVSSTFLHLLLSCFLFFIVLFFDYSFPFINSIRDYNLAIFIYYVSYMFFKFSYELANSEKQTSTIAISTIICGLSTVILNILFLLVFGYKLNGYFMTFSIGQLLAGTFIFCKLRAWKYLTFKYDSKIIKEMLKYSVPGMIGELAWWIINFSDRYIVSGYCGINANGLLGISYKLPSIITILQTVFNQAWLYSVFENKNNKDYYKKIFVLYNVALCLLCSFLILINKEIAILYAKDFYEAWMYVPFLLISNIMTGLSVFLWPIFSLEKKLGIYTISTVVGGGINIFLDILLTSKIGIQGATIATLFSTVVVFFIRYLTSGKVIKYKKQYLVYLTWIVLVVQATINIYFHCFLFDLISLFLIIFINFNVISRVIKKLVIFLKKDKLL